jgi:hypothetical protein
MAERLLAIDKTHQEFLDAVGRSDSHVTLSGPRGVGISKCGTDAAIAFLMMNPNNRVCILHTNHRAGKSMYKSVVDKFGEDAVGRVGLVTPRRCEMLLQDNEGFPMLLISCEIAVHSKRDRIFRFINIYHFDAVIALAIFDDEPLTSLPQLNLDDDAYYAIEAKK